MLHNEVFLVAMFLNPRYRKMVTSKYYTIQFVLEKMGALLIKWEYSLEESRNIIQLARLYENGDAPFQSRETDPKAFWRSSPDNPLQTFAERLLSTPPHSACVEGLFSRHAYVRDKHHTRMSQKTVTSFHKLKLLLKEGDSGTSSDSETVEVEAINDEDTEVSNFEGVEETLVLTDVPAIELYFDENAWFVPVPRGKEEKKKFNLTDLFEL